VYRILLSFVFFCFLGAFSQAHAEYRIVSLAPNVTEILFEIGLGDQVVGVTDKGNYPAKVKNITKIGSYYRPSIEKILMLEPTHVLGMREGYTKRLKYKLDKLGIRNRFFKVDEYRDISRMIGEIGKIFGKSTESIRSRIDTYFNSGKIDYKGDVVFLISAKPAYAVGGGNFVNDILKCANLRNALAGSENDFPQINYEKILQLNPDYIILAKRHGNSQADSFFYEKIERFGEETKILEVKPDIFLRPSYRIIDACKTLKKLIR